MKQACKYAIIQFMPYPETGEFANVGILVCSPKTGYIDFKLAPTRFGRVTNFFDDMKAVYKEALKLFEEELNAVKLYAHDMHGKKQLVFIEEITRQRASLLRFGELRTIATETPKELLNQLYEHYVGRDFVTKEYRERTMATALRKHFTTHKLPVKYKEVKLETDLVEVTFPLVGQVENKLRVIKPLAFNHIQSTKLIEHGEAWLNKVRWLIKGNAVDAERVLFTVESPKKTNNSKLTRAYDEVLHEMRALQINVLPYEEKEKIINFAAADLSTDTFRLH